MDSYLYFIMIRMKIFPSTYCDLNCCTKIDFIKANLQSNLHNIGEDKNKKYKIRTDNISTYFINADNYPETQR